MANITINTLTFKAYRRNNKDYFAIYDSATDKTERVETKEEFEKRIAEAQAAEKAGENKTERRAKGERYADAEQAPEVVLAAVPTEYTITEDSRGRIAYMQGKAKIVGIQPAKTHYTVYISKHLLATPKQVTEALSKTFKIDAKVNPTFITNKGHDSFSVKATVKGATRDQLDNMVNLLIAKNNEVVKA